MLLCTSVVIFNWNWKSVILSLSWRIIFSSFLKLNNEMSQDREFTIPRYVVWTLNFHIVLFHHMNALTVVLNVNLVLSLSTSGTTKFWWTSLLFIVYYYIYYFLINSVFMIINVYVLVLFFLNIYYCTFVCIYYSLGTY